MYVFILGENRPNYDSTKVTIFWQIWQRCL